MIRFSQEVIESSLLKKIPHLILLGKVSTSVLEQVQKGFSKDRDKKGTSFFVNYAETEINIGYKFSRAFSFNIKEAEIIDCELVDVTQQYAKPFDCIPQGWKTISKFKFLNDKTRLFRIYYPKAFIK